MTTRIIATIGPASSNPHTLEYFKNHGVSIARLNFSHGTIESHLKTAELCSEAGLDIMFDLSGPKIHLGELSENFHLEKNQSIYLEPYQPNIMYPYSSKDENGAENHVLPCRFQIQNFVKKGMSIYIDDGKIRLLVKEIKQNIVVCTVVAGGIVKSNKGVNIPGTDPDIEFLDEHDKVFLAELLRVIKPKYVAASFVRYPYEIKELKHYISTLLNTDSDYFPKICSKIEQQQAVESQNLFNIIMESDMIMVARGDLALETEPTHIMVPFYQAEIVKACQMVKKPFIIATQMLESMITSSVPTRAEVSDIYRAIAIDNASYIMLSAETAAGMYPCESVKMMYDLIQQYQHRVPLTINVDKQKINA